MNYNPYTNIKTIADLEGLLDDDNLFIIPLCKSIVTLTSKFLDPYNDSYITVDRNHATVMGLLVKILKCYQECVKLYEEEKCELISLYSRIIYEAFIKMKYLIKYGEKTQKHYRLISYKSRFDFYIKTKDEEGERKNYYWVRNKKFLDALSEDGFTLEDLGTVKNWKLDGKNFRQLLQEIESDELYTSLYGIGSDSVHSDWGEIRSFHLMGKEDTMCAKVEYYKPHYRVIIHLGRIQIDATIAYIEWFEKELESKILSPFLELLLDLERVIDIIDLDILKTYADNPQKYLYE